MSLKLLGIYTNPMPQHQGGQVTTQGPTPVQTNPGPSASANTIRACTAARREMPVKPPQRKAPMFHILKKCMTRLEALRLIRNGPTHPAMMHDRRERAQKKMEFPSWVRLTSGKKIFQDFLSYVELSLYYLLLECTGNFW
ncbi:hypothetical protein LguiA_035908 [Lonicera macranthoides]